MKTELVSKQIITELNTRVPWSGYK